MLALRFDSLHFATIKANYMFTRILISFCLLFFSSAYLSGQSVLDQYIQEAMQSNIALKQQYLSYDKSVAVLQEAKANFLPQLSIESRYSVARGGRAFVIPVGDLVNPIYQNLNIVNQLGQSASPDYPVIPEYPAIDNVEENFLRETEQETTLRVIMPIYNNAIINNQKIQTKLVEANRIGINAYKRILVAEVKTAYFNYWKAAEAFDLYENTLQLVEENLRTTESLFNNHQVTKDVVYLASAQVEELKQQLAEAEKNKKVTQSFFNFLLNRDYTKEILPADQRFSAIEVSALETNRLQALQSREELDQLNYAMSATDQKIQINRGSYLPTINLIADYGVQGTRFSFTDEDDFFMGSLVMSWKLFQPTQKAKTQQVQIEKMELFQQKEALKQQIGLQVVQAWYDVEAARKSVSQAAAEVNATQQAFKLINKKFEQGQANLVTWTDARTRQTTAQQKGIIARYDYQIKLAALEKASASYKL